jgi:hypothetical protein
MDISLKLAKRKFPTFVARQIILSFLKLRVFAGTSIPGSSSMGGTLLC